jgi:hypothetical protein
VIATLFHHPIVLPFGAQLWLVLPLCAVVAIVYKTIRVPDLRHLWRAVAGLMAYMVAGLVVLSAVLWLIDEYWP